MSRLIALAFALSLAGVVACNSNSKTDPAAADAGADAAACTFTGSMCDGDVLQTCTNGALVLDDCGAQLASCTGAPGAAACVDPCADRGITETGVCTATSAQRCETQGGKHVVVTDVCDPDQTCSIPTGGSAHCGNTNACAGIGPSGRCTGDVLTTCSNNTPVTTDCASTSQTCAYVDATSSFGCVSAGTVGAFAVSGTAKYEDKPPQTNGSLGAIGQKPVRGAQITVVNDSTMAVLATGVTADDGSYTLHFDATAGAMVHVLVASQSTLAIRPAKVLKTSTQVYGFGGTSFAAAAASTSNVLVTDASGVSEAFNIFDQMVRTMDGIRTVLGDATPTPLSARWTKGGTNGTFYSAHTLYLLGASDDDDGYDDTVILHETGHFVEDTEGRSDSPGGSHDGSADDPRLAWSEGFSTYWAMTMRGAPIYMDSNASGGWGYNADTSKTLAPTPTGGMDQQVSEDMITEDLWDIGDSTAPDDDAMVTSSHTDVARVQVDYLRSATLRNVGTQGVDLVDFLDGWFAHAGLDGCSAIRGIVTTTRKFPYDFKPPAGNCP